MDTERPASRADKPTHIIYAVRDFENSDEALENGALKIGVGYDRLDGRGLDLVFDALPVTGRVAVRANDCLWPEVNQQELWEHKKREYRLMHPRRFDRLQPL